MKWFASVAPSRPRLLLTPAEDGPRKTLRSLIYQRFGIRAELPGHLETIEC